MWYFIPIALALLATSLSNYENRVHRSRWLLLSLLAPYGLLVYAFLRRRKGQTLHDNVFYTIIVGLPLTLAWYALPTFSPAGDTPQVKSALSPSEQIFKAVKNSSNHVFDVLMSNPDPYNDEKGKPYRFIEADLYYQGFSDEGIVDQIGQASWEILKEVHQDNPETFKTTIIRAYTDVVDQYGSSSKKVVLKLEYPMAEVNKIVDWDNVGPREILNFSTPYPTSGIARRGIASYCSNQDKLTSSMSFCLNFLKEYQ